MTSLDEKALKKLHGKRISSVVGTCNTWPHFENQVAQRRIIV
jgi:hypothetical protein